MNQQRPGLPMKYEFDDARPKWMAIIISFRNEKNNLQYWIANATGWMFLHTFRILYFGHTRKTMIFGIIVKPLWIVNNLVRYLQCKQVNSIIWSWSTQRYLQTVVMWIIKHVFVRVGKYLGSSTNEYFYKREVQNLECIFFPWNLDNSVYKNVIFKVQCLHLN